MLFRSGVVVMLVGTQVIGQLVDTSGQDRDLNFGRTGIALVGSDLQDDLRLLFLLNHCVFHLSINSPQAKYRVGVVPKPSNGHDDFPLTIASPTILP